MDTFFTKKTTTKKRCAPEALWTNSITSKVGLASQPEESQLDFITINYIFGMKYKP